MAKNIEEYVLQKILEYAIKGQKKWFIIENYKDTSFAVGGPSNKLHGPFKDFKTCSDALKERAEYLAKEWTNDGLIQKSETTTIIHKLDKSFFISRHFDWCTLEMIELTL